jgi:DNA-binding MltR family transcriptional regulator
MGKRWHTMEADANIQKAVDYSSASEWALHFEASIKKESTRATVVLSACYLDEMLCHLLKAILAPSQERTDPLFDGRGPLNTFSAKIEMATRMGAISKDTKQSLHYVRRIRNEFAHNIADCTFANSKIADWNTELHKLNDIATPECRASFTDGPEGDFEHAVSWLIFWLRVVIQKLPTKCPGCGSKMEYRSRLMESSPCDSI